jgi:hypothetical protein
MSRGRWLSPDEVAAAKRMREEGLPWRKIGKILRRDPKGLCQACGFMKAAGGQMRRYVPRGTRGPLPKNILTESPLGPNGGLLTNNPPV